MSIGSSSSMPEPDLLVRTRENIHAVSAHTNHSSAVASPLDAKASAIALSHLGKSDLAEGESKITQGGKAAYALATRATKETKGKQLLLLRNGSGEIALSIAEKTAVRVPGEASLKLSRWLSQQEAAGKMHPGRVAYRQEEVPAALRRFEEEFHCSWGEMKHHCKDEKVLQIVNDLRAAYLEETFGELRKEFSGVLKGISDFGSNKLTSDRDFAFQVSKEKQTTETVIVKRFNEIFEAKWGAPSAVVFDSNAYTMQYVLSANNPQFEASRSQMQQEGSLLMKLRNATSESWALFKSETLANLPSGLPRIEKEAEFHKIEGLNLELKTLLDKEIVKRGAALPGGEKVDVDALSPLQIAEAADAIRKANSDLEIQASNGLHAELKTAAKHLESQRAGLQIALKGLAKDAKDGEKDKFSLAFNSRLNRMILNLQEEITAQKDPSIKVKLQGQKRHLESSRIESREEQEEVMLAYKDLSLLQEKQLALHKERSDVEAQAVKCHDLLAKLEGIGARETNGGNGKEMAALSDEYRHVKGELAKLGVLFGVTSERDLLPALQEKIGNLDGKLAAWGREKEALRMRYDEEGKAEALEKAAILGLESDRLLVNIQTANVVGMCFAAEAHISEGAFAVVVLDLQAKKGDVRTLNQYVQAFREISGFCSGHQVHQKTPHGRMIEASKYADRLMSVSKMINNRARALDIAPPRADVGALEAFFTSVAPMRGTAKSDAELQAGVELAARASGLIGPAEPFNAGVVDRVNRQIEQIGASFEAWISRLPEKDRNAYYKVA